MTIQFSSREFQAAPGTHLFASLRREVWVFPSLAMTLLLLLFTLIAIDDKSAMLPTLMVFPNWIFIWVVLGTITNLASSMARKVANPLSGLTDNLAATGRKFLPIAILTVLSGLNMMAFMWVKPYLNHVVPFWADPLLADMDKLLFLGSDPWTALQGLNTSFFDALYHQGWFVFLVLALVIASGQKPSLKKSAIITTYFALWTFVGPLIHLMLPAGGPIFFEHLGYGDRFAALESFPGRQNIVDYLWSLYSSGEYGPAAGISAMPSMHVATTTWAVMCFHAFARRLFPVALAFGFLILLLSIALGWHYAMDGVVAVTATVGTYFGKTALLKRFIPDTGTQTG